MVEEKYWFGFRQTKLLDANGKRYDCPGSVATCGPFGSREIAAKNIRDGAGWDSVASVIFTADTEEEARKKAESLTPMT